MSVTYSLLSQPARNSSCARDVPSNNSVPASSTVRSTVTSTSHGSAIFAVRRLSSDAVHTTFASLAIGILGTLHLTTVKERIARSVFRTLRHRKTQSRACTRLDAVSAGCKKVVGATKVLQRVALKRSSLTTQGPRSIKGKRRSTSSIIRFLTRSRFRIV